MRKTTLLILAICLAGLVAVVPLHAGSSMMDTKGSLPSDDLMAAFCRGALDLQIVVGAEESIQETSAGRPNIDYALTAFRLGYMLDSVRGTGLLRGNNEAMVEAIGGPIFGPGTALGGVALIYRRNFVPPCGRFIPYINLGAGGIYSDAYHHKTQRALGSPFEFDLLAGIGGRYRFDAHWSMDGEISFRHLSNADFASRNYGTNALGGLLGFSFAF